MLEFKKRSDIHWARKIWHVGGVGLLTLIYAYVQVPWSQLALLGIWLFFVPGDILRTRFAALNEFVVFVFRPILRESEIQKASGLSYLLTGVLIVAWIFPRDVVLLTLLFLGLADPVASYFGIRFGKDKIFGHKSVQGSAAAFLVCAALMASFLFYQGYPTDRLVLLSLIGGLIGALAELIPVAKLDDNFTLPMISAVCLWLLFEIFGTLTLVN